ncbi:MAG: cardiolipin synthase [Clostridia bacterium]|nr:cardiolipin synthase [Clostridia bacterium]
MKKNIRVTDSRGRYIDKEINYIPTRYIISMLVMLFEIVAILGIMVLLALYVPYFYIAIYITEIVSIITIVVSSGNPDYKVAWLFFVIMLPLVGLMLYLIFHKRKLPKKAIKRYNILCDSYDFDDSQNQEDLKNQDKLLFSQAVSLSKMSNSHLYKNTNLKYYPLGEDMYKDMLEELKKSEKFILMEYFIVEDGIFWSSILEILKQKASQNVEVKLVYDDIGCMGTLPGNYYKILKKKYNIDTVLFSKLKGNIDGEFNNRSHGKILVVDGKVGFTGGINIADEYINQNDRLGHWKDTGIRLEGLAVNELTKLFLTDFYINVKNKKKIDFQKYYIAQNLNKNFENFVIPFGDGPKPIYDYDVAKYSIINLLNQAQDYVYINTPYLVIDKELSNAISNTALRGVDVRMLVPHIPDKKLVFNITRSSYRELMLSGVKVYEYTPGFVHAKSYIADDNFGIIGTINLDYRSLTHHFENGVWIYDTNIIREMKDDFCKTLDKSQYMNDTNFKESIFVKLLNIIVKLFSPLL